MAKKDAEERKKMEEKKRHEEKKKEDEKKGKRRRKGRRERHKRKVSRGFRKPRHRPQQHVNILSTNSCARDNEPQRSRRSRRITLTQWQEFSS